MGAPEKSKLYRFLRLDNIIEHLTGLLEARIELIKLEAKEEIAKIGARLIALIALAFLGVLIIIFLSLALATWFNSLLGSSYWGYFIVTGFYLLLFVLLIVLRAHLRLQAIFEKLLIDNLGAEDDD